MKKCFVGTEDVPIGDSERIKLDYFLLTERKKFEGQISFRSTYGIEIVKNNIESQNVRDISVNKNEVIGIIEVLKSNQVTPIHLNDVIETFL